MKIFFIGRAVDVSASLKRLAAENKLLTAEQYLLNVARERRTIAALAKTQASNVAGGATVSR